MNSIIEEKKEKKKFYDHLLKKIIKYFHCLNVVINLREDNVSKSKSSHQGKQNQIQIGR